MHAIFDGRNPKRSVYSRPKSCNSYRPIAASVLCSFSPVFDGHEFWRDFSGQNFGERHWNLIGKLSRRDDPADQVRAVFDPRHADA